MGQHAKLFSASASSRWLTCTASVWDTLDLPDKTTEFAAEGTVAHELADRCLNNGREPKEFLGETWTVLKLRHDESDDEWDEVQYLPYHEWVESNDRGHEFEVLQHFEFEICNEMVRHVADYVAYCESLIEPGSDVGCEVRVDYSPWTCEGDGFGTNDFSVATDNTLHVVDLKYGKGVQVFAEENTQAMLYALGKWNELNLFYDFEKIVVHIYQPRLNHIDVWETSVDHLLDFADNTVKPAADKILAKDVDYVVSEKGCEFCKKKATCKALYEHTMAIVADEFDDIYEVEFKEQGDLNGTEIARLIPNLDLIIKWCKSVEAHAMRQLEQDPTSVPGYKRVRGRSSRAWSNAEEAFERMKKTKFKLDEIAPRSPISPTQFEKLAGKNSKLLKPEEGLVMKPPGKPVLAKSDDKRQSIEEEIANDFDDDESDV